MNITNEPAGIDLDNLEALARAATPGPWIYFYEGGGDYPVIRRNSDDDEIVCCSRYHCEQSHEVMSANAQYVASVDPATVLALIALARRAPAPVAALDAPEAAHADDDQAWDREAERLTREMGLGSGKINPNATSVMDLFVDDDEAAHAQQEAAPVDLSASIVDHVYEHVGFKDREVLVEDVHAMIAAVPTTVPDHSEREAANAGDLSKRLRIKAGMITVGEQIAWGSDAALMNEAADFIDRAPASAAGEGH